MKSIKKIGKCSDCYKVIKSTYKRCYTCNKSHKATNVKKSLFDTYMFRKPVKKSLK